MYERLKTPPIAHHHFRRRFLLHGLVAASLLLVSLGIGMAGYRYFEHLGWRDAFVNAAMLLAGMGPIELDLSEDGKVFAGIYALYAGLVFLGVAAILVAPVAHRVLHKFHWETDDR